MDSTGHAAGHRHVHRRDRHRLAAGHFAVARSRSRPTPPTSSRTTPRRPLRRHRRLLRRPASTTARCTPCRRAPRAATASTATAPAAGSRPTRSTPPTTGSTSSSAAPSPTPPPPRSSARRPPPAPPVSPPPPTSPPRSSEAVQAGTDLVRPQGRGRQRRGRDRHLRRRHPHRHPRPRPPPSRPDHLHRHGQRRQGPRRQHHGRTGHLVVHDRHRDPHLDADHATDFGAGTHSGHVPPPAATSASPQPTFIDDFTGATLGSTGRTNSWAGAGGGPTSVTALRRHPVGRRGPASSRPSTPARRRRRPRQLRRRRLPALRHRHRLRRPPRAITGPIFSTAGTTNTLFARVNDNGATQDVSLGALPSGFHTYNVTAGRRRLPVLRRRRPRHDDQRDVPRRHAAEDRRLGVQRRTPMTVDSSTLLPSRPTGTFTSSVFDAGASRRLAAARGTPRCPPARASSSRPAAAERATPTARGRPGPPSPPTAPSPARTAATSSTASP